MYDLQSRKVNLLLRDILIEYFCWYSVKYYNTIEKRAMGFSDTYEPCNVPICLK